jgi:hypothetical protein
MCQSSKRLSGVTPSSGVQVIRGAQEVIEATIELIASAGTPQQGDEILLSFQGEPEVLDKAPTLRQAWWQALRTATDQGWKVTHLLRVSEEPVQILNLAKEIIDNISLRSDYNPYYFHQYGALSPPYDILVVPGQGAMQFFATEQPDYIDSAIYTPDPQFNQITQTLKGYFRQLVAPGKASPLMKMYAKNMVSSYEVIANFELAPGGRFCIQQSFSALTRPESFLREDGKWAQAIKALGADQSRLLALYRQRLKVFKKQLREYLFREICSKRALERLRDYGEYDKDAPNREDVPESIAHLENVIELLRHPDYNFELALVDKSEEHLLPSPAFISKPHAVLLATVPAVEGNPFAQIEMTEPKIVQGFNDYFTYVWNQIKEENKNKEQVIAWLKKQVASLRAQQKEQGLTRD